MKWLFESVKHLIKLKYHKFYSKEMVMKVSGSRWKKILSQPNLISQILQRGAVSKFFIHQIVCFAARMKCDVLSMEEDPVKMYWDARRKIT
jgi:hypothetical protein